MAGTLVISTLSDGTNSTSSTNAIQGSAKAWVNFNGTTGAIRASYNVSSVTRTGTADYTVNFTAALSDANYAVSCSTGRLTGGTSGNTHGLIYDDASVPTTTGVRLSLSSNADPQRFCVSIFR